MAGEEVSKLALFPPKRAFYGPKRPLRHAARPTGQTLQNEPTISFSGIFFEKYNILTGELF